MASVNHHYIPKLYLNGFTSINGRLQVYNKKFSKFEPDKHTPKTIFFEKNKNTIIFNGVETDEIESLYSTIENGFGTLFNAIRNGLCYDDLISEHGLYLFKMYIAIQFWRLPITDEFSEHYIDNIDLSRFGNRITRDGVPLGGIKEISELLKNDKGFRHYFRCFFLPLLTFNTNVHKGELDSWQIYDVSSDYDNWENYLCSDNPLIVEDITNIFQFKSKLILPLSKTKLLTYSPNKLVQSSLAPIFSTKLAMLSFSQTKKYIVGANRCYMEEIIEIYNRVYGQGKDKELRDEVFSFV